MREEKYLRVIEARSGQKNRKMADDNSLKLQTYIKLEGTSNWNIWKFQTIVLLRSQGLLEVTDGSSVKPEEAVEKAAWEKKDAKAQSWLVTRMSESVMMHIITCTTSAEIWRKLASVYEQKSETSIDIVGTTTFLPIQVRGGHGDVYVLI